jgi:DNA-binding NarL/FixJ family response regulator
MIRVAIVDDHAVVRAGLEQVIDLAEDIELVGSGTDGAEAEDIVGQLEPDVVLMDLSMPGLDGIEATKRVLAARPETQVLVLTSFSDRDRILKALDAGACGYLLKDAEPDELLRRR